MTASPEKDDVSTALDDLRQTLDGEKERLNEVAAQAMKDGAPGSSGEIVPQSPAEAGAVDDTKEVVATVADAEDFDQI